MTKREDWKIRDDIKGLQAALESARNWDPSPHRKEVIAGLKQRLNALYSELAGVAPKSDDPPVDAPTG